MPAGRIVDLSLPIRPHVRWKTEVTVVSDFEAPSHPFRSSRLAMPGHGFTHCDGFSHFVPGGLPVDAVPLDTWIGEAAVVDLTHVGADTGISADDLAARGAHVRRGDIALLRTDWPRRRSWETPEFWTEAPYTTLEACRWLVERGVKAVGYDYPPDRPIRYMVTGRWPAEVLPEEWATHHTFFPASIGVIEYLTNLDGIGRDRVRFVALPLRLEGGDGAPARAIAILD
jgi:arylformamidase